MKDLKIQKLELNNIEEIMKIELEAFTSCFSTNLYTKEITNENNIYLKGSIENKIVGFIGSNIICDEAHITRIAVAYNHRKNGIASSLLHHLFYILSHGKSVKKILLEVRKFNLPAINFYKKHGFKIDGIRKGYYSDSGDDAILMSKKFDG